MEHQVPSLNPVLLRASVLAGLIMGLMGVGFLVARLEQPEAALLAIAAPVMVLLAFSRLEYGVLAIVPTAAFVRFSLPTGTQSRIVASLLLTAILIVIWLARMLLVEKKLQLKPSKTNLPLLSFISATFISYIWSNAFRDPLVVTWATWPFVQIGALAVMVFLPGAFLLVSNRLTEIKWLKWLTALILAVGLLAILQGYLPFLDFLQVRPLFPMWFICLAYSQVLFNHRLPALARLLLLIFVGAWLYRVVVVQIAWFSAWVPSVLAMGIISFWRSRLLFFILLLIALGLAIANLGYLQAIYEAQREESGETRLNAYVHNWRVTGKHLLFGVGPAGYAAYYMSYFPGEAMATHSNYLDVLSQTGLVGLLSFLGFFFALALTARDLLLCTRGRFDFMRAFSVGVAGGLAGVIVATGLGDWLLPFTYTQTIAGFDYAVYSWVLLGAIVSLHRLVSEEGPAHV